jgi:L-gulonate 5-dehydrogenase
MRAAVTVEPELMRIADVPDPAPSAGEAIVRIERVGLCGSDYHFFLGEHPYATYPLTQGHELAGVVEFLDDAYDGPVGVGDRVAIEPLLPCGSCFACRRGRYNCCASLRVIGAHVPGGLCERFAVPATALHPVGDLDPELAALCEPVSIGLQAVTRSRVREGESLVVLGAGPIGQAVTLSAHDRGARVLVTDRIPARLEIAMRLGADVTVDSSAGDLARRVSEWTDGEGPAVVIDATGVPELIRLGVDLVAPSGVLVIVGISHHEVSIPVIEFSRKELDVLGSRNNAGLFPDAVDLVARSQERVRNLITHTYPLEETPEAIRFAIDHPEEVEKVIVCVPG